MKKEAKSRYFRVAVLMVLLCITAVAAQKHWLDYWISKFSTAPRLPAAAAAGANPASDILAKIEAEARRPVAPSSWLEAEQKRHVALLAQAKPDVVVLPYQIPVEPNKFGIDIAARMIMAYMTAQRIVGHTKLKVADVGLVARAVGEPRYLNREDALAFGRAVGAGTVFYGHAWHDGSGKFAVRLARISTSPDAAWTIANADNIAISDTITPELAFREVIDNIVQQLGITTRLEPKIYSIKDNYFPTSPVAATGVDSVNPVEGIWIQELLATLYPLRTHRARARAFERAMAGLDFVSPDSPDYRLLAARALVQLNRRPAALVMIGNPQSAEEVAFVEYLNGNLPEMTAAIAKIKRPLPRLLAELDLIWMRRAYQLDSGDTLSLAVQFAKRVPQEWQPSVAWTIALQNEWQMRSNTEIKGVMDAHFPLAGTSAEELLKGKTAGESPNDQRRAVELEGLPFGHANIVVEQKGAQWCCTSQAWQPYPAQYLSLLTAFPEAMLLHTVQHYYGTQGNAAQALQLIDLLNQVIFHDGDIGLQLLKMRVLGTLIEGERDPGRNKDLADRMYQAAIQVRQWETADAGTIHDAVRYEKWATAIRYDLAVKNVIYPEVNSFKTDFPPTWNFLRTSDPYRSAIDTAKNIEIIERTCSYSVIGMRSCFAWRSALAATGQVDEAMKYEKEKLRPRFHGNPYSLVSLMALMKDRGEMDNARALAQESIAVTPKSVEGYYQLGRMALTTGDYANAQKIFLSYPLLQDPKNANAVHLSNIAFAAAEGLAIRGATKEARPLYDIAAKFANGSAAAEHANMKIAYMDRRFEDAKTIALGSMKHYPGTDLTYDYLALTFAMGDSSEAWSMARYPSSYSWGAVPVGFRAEGSSAAKVLEWAKVTANLPVRQARDPDNQRLYALTIAIAAMATDRSAEAMTQIAGVRRGVFPNSEPQDLTNPDARKRNYAVGTQIDYLDRFVAGYSAHKRNDFQSAWKIFQNWPVGGRSDVATDTFVFVLPYFAYAAVKTNQTGDFNGYLENYKKPLLYTPLDRPPVQYPRFDIFLANAVLAALQGNHDEAKKNLLNAQTIGQTRGARPLPPEYVFAEVCELLGVDTGVRDYLEIGVNWAKSFQVYEPWSAWAYAFEAKHGKNENERAKAYAMARYLDKDSARLVAIEPHIIKKADEWLFKNKPFPRNSAANAKAL